MEVIMDFLKDNIEIITQVPIVITVLVFIFMTLKNYNDLMKELIGIIKELTRR